MRMASLARSTAMATIAFSAAFPASALEIPAGLATRAMERSSPGVADALPPVLFAQVGGDPVERINQLEEENRRLTGRIEELSFQLLQMQEQIRKTQEDNEFRFQDLEKANSSGGGAPAPNKRTQSAPAASEPDIAAAAPPVAPGSSDDIGNLLGSGKLETGAIAPPAKSAPPPAASAGASDVKPGKAGGMYDLAYNYLLAGDYKLAEDQFRQYLQTYPDAADAPDAQYWLGESLYAQAKYTDAAEVFLNAQKAHPKSPKAPEMMLKLGMSLAKLDSRDTACATFREVAKRYPQMSANVKRKLQSESTASSC